MVEWRNARSLASVTASGAESATGIHTRNLATFLPVERREIGNPCFATSDSREGLPGPGPGGRAGHTPGARELETRSQQWSRLPG
jgi:hypothetical protein